MIAAASWAEAGGLMALALLLLLVCAVAVYLSLGLFQARSLIRRELAAYFLSPIAYVILVVLLLVMGFLFFLAINQLTARGPTGTEWPMQSMFGWLFWSVFLFIPPALTMRLFAEERASGTLETLMTSPVRDWQIVLAKFVACFVFFLLLWVPTLAYLPVLLDLKNLHVHPVISIGVSILAIGAVLVVAGLVVTFLRLGTEGRVAGLALVVVGLLSLAAGGYRHYVVEPARLAAAAEGGGAETGKFQPIVTVEAGIDPYPALSTYLGLVLAGAMFLSIGILISSLVRDQLVAFIITWVISLIFIVVGLLVLTGLVPLNMNSDDPLYRFVYFFSVPLHFYRGFTRGIVDTRHLALYGSVTLACLFFTVRSLESRRWR
jgi:ABC-type transport system involved in multi-copper enzyme maturation permease subunit